MLAGAVAPGAAAGVHVKGLRELQQAFALAEREARLFVRAELRHVAEPIRAEAEQLALTSISGMGRNRKSAKWGKMRVGVTRTLIYVAPRQRGRLTKQNPDRWGRGYYKGDFGGRLMRVAMEPALEHHAPDVEARMEHALDRMADHFNRGGTVI
jgi:hypothetical protein